MVISDQILSHLASKQLEPSPAWLSQFLSSQRLTTPLPALKQTALFRLLASDFTKSLASPANMSFPADILNAEMVQRTLSGPIPVQIVDIEDVSQSKWSQIQDIEAAERGETTKGREIIRVVPGEEGQSDSSVTKGGPHKLLLQDNKGSLVYGFELANIEGLSAAISMGAKMMLKDVTLARGVLMLQPDCVFLLGGKIEDLDKAWKKNRKEKLKRSIDSVQI